MTKKLPKISLIFFVGVVFMVTSCRKTSEISTDIILDIKGNGQLADTSITIEPFTLYQGKFKLTGDFPPDRYYLYTGEFSSFELGKSVTGYAEYPVYERSLRCPIYFPLDATSNREWDYEIYHYNSYNVPYTYKPQLVKETQIDESINAYKSNTRQQVILYAFIIGLLVAFFLYAIINLVLYRELYFLFYIIYILSSIFYSLLEDERHLEFNVLFSDYPRSFIFFYSLFNLISIIAYINFFQLFLQMKGRENFLYQIIVVLTAVLSISVVADFALNYNGYYVLAFYQSLFARLSALFLGVYSIVILFRRKDQITNLILFGTLIWLVTTLAYTIVGILKTRGVISTSYYFNPHLILQVGTLLELTLFNIAINARQKEKAIQGQLNSEKLKIYEEGNKRMQNFYTSITHEFKTPLTMITGLTKEVENQKIKKGISKHANNLLELINQLLHLGNNSDQKRGTLKFIRINEFMESMVDSFKDLAVHRSISLAFHSDVDDLIVELDEEKLRFMMNNLLKNAFDNTPKYGSIIISLKVQASKHIFISVKDTGKGITEEDLPRIFEKFYKGSNAEEYGSGIGLTIVKDHVESMGGRINVNSKVGKGSLFRIQLPLVLADGKMEASDIHSSEEVGETLVVDELTQEVTNPKLLIIEDNYEISNLLKRLLESSYRISIAADGKEGISCAQEEIPDIIITDLMMPELDGLSMIKTLKNNSMTVHIPIIVVSAKSNDQDIVDVKKAGASSFIKKPFNPEILLAEIQQVLAQRKIYQDYYLREGQNGDNSAIDPFIKKFESLVLENLANPDLNMTFLSKNLYLDRTQIYRKVKALTGLSPSEFIKQKRMIEAKVLILSKEFTIEEVAEKVGFSSGSQFSKVFKAFHKANPSQLKH